MPFWKIRASRLIYLSTRSLPQAGGDNEDESDKEDEEEGKEGNSDNETSLAGSIAFSSDEEEEDDEEGNDEDDGTSYLLPILFHFLFHPNFSRVCACDRKGARPSSCSRKSCPPSLLPSFCSSPTHPPSSFPIFPSPPSVLHQATITPTKRKK